MGKDFSERYLGRKIYRYELQVSVLSMDGWTKGAIRCGRDPSRGACHGVDGHQEGRFGDQGWLCLWDVLVERMR